VADAAGVTKIYVVAKNPYQQVVSNSFVVTVQSENDAPVITQVPNQTIFSGTASPTIDFTYSDAETPRKDLILSVSTSNPELIPTNNIILGGTMVIAPVGALSGKSEIAIRVTDPQGQASQTAFTVTVVPALQPQFANPQPLTIPTTVGTASPYPLTNLVQGVQGTVGRVTVTLAQLTHGYPADLDMLLVGPQGQKVILMSDAGGSVGVTDIRLTFDDRVTNSLPFNPNASAGITSGTYRPTNYPGSVDDFPNAPAGPISTNLSVFNGTDPNGTWGLYVVDTFAGFGGGISGGYIINIYTTTPTISQIGDQTTEENVVLSIPFTVDDADTPATNLITAATTDNTALLALSITGTGNNRVLNITPTSFAAGEGNVTLAVTDGSGVANTRFKVTVSSVNQGPVISGLTDQFLPSNQTGQFPFTVFDRETAASNLVLSATTLRPNFATVSITGTDTNRVLVFLPSGDQGQTFVSVTASDGQITTTNTISVEVGAPHALVVSPIADQTVPANSPVTVAFTVSGDFVGEVRTAGTASNTNLVRSITTAGSGTNFTASIVLVQDASGQSVITITASDDRGAGSTTFKLTVIAAASEPPKFAPIPPQSTRPGVAAVVPLIVVDSDTPSDKLIFTWTASNTNIVRGVLFGQTGPSNFVATVNVRNNEGTSEVTISVSDGGTPVSQSFVLTVVENPPFLNPIPDQITSKDTPLSIPLAVTDIDTPLNQLVFSSKTSNAGLVASTTFDISTGTAIATITPVAGQTGAALMTFTVSDSSGGTSSQSFALAVIEAVEPPVLAIVRAGNSVTVTWENGGELEIADSVLGPWNKSGNTSGTYTEAITAAARFFRVAR
jgi:subtilisin-like proprotein convertase family protein